MANITAIVLTKDEELHLQRALDSLGSLGARILIVDSGSKDRTVQIAQMHGARILSNPWINYATQFNWALGQLPDDTEWILRLDADEVVTEGLAAEINEELASLPASIDGIYISRRMNFLGRPIRWGGLFPVRVLRIFRHGKGRCESRWMDEHILVEGEAANFHGEIIDDNLNSLTWWTEKHNAYASREVVDLLNLQYGFMAHETIAGLRGGKQAGVKRWLKEQVYTRMPGGARATAYFLYRYFLRLGFLDGKEGSAFHVLQGFWYRYLVDMKLHQVKTYMRTKNVDAVTAIRDVLNISVQPD